MRTYLTITLCLIGMFNPYLHVRSETTIYVGTSSAQSGPVKLGTDMVIGMKTYFKKFNQTTTQDYKFELMSLDDRYELYFTELNMTALLNNPDVVAIIGNVGTSTATVALPMALERDTVFFGAVSGAQMLRKNPADRVVYNFRASYKQEIDYILRDIQKHNPKFENLGLFIQDDSFGMSGYRAAVEMLRTFNVSDEQIKKIPVGRYSRNTVDILHAANMYQELDISHDTRDFIMVGTGKAIANFIKIMKSEYPNSHFYTLSFSGLDSLKNHICARNMVLCREYTKNVKVAQVVPHYINTSLPIVSAYLKDLHEIYPNQRPNQTSLEGYIVAKLFVHAMQRDLVNLTRKKVLENLEKMEPVDIGLGYELDFSNVEHQASDAVWLLELEKLKFTRVLFANERRMIERVIPKLRALIERPEIIAALKVQNERHKNLTTADITQLDKQWIKEQNSKNKPLIHTVTEHAVADHLRVMKKSSQQVLDEIFIFDAYGLNMAAAMPPSDYWQGDERKYQKTVLRDEKAYFIGDIEFDESSADFKTQVSLTIKEKDKVIGGVTFGLNLDYLKVNPALHLEALSLK